MTQLEFFEKKKMVYFILISPGEDGISEVRKLKTLLNDSFGISEKNLYSVPHISLFQEVLLEENEGQILKTCQDILKDISAFQVNTTDVNFFSNPKGVTHILSVSNERTITEISIRLYRDLRNKKFKITPHVTVAKMQSLENQQAMHQLILENYEPVSFWVDRILVLKKGLFDKNYQRVTEVKIG